MLQELPRVLPTIEAVRKALWTADIAGLIDADGWNNDEYDAYAPTLQSWLAEQLVLPTVESVVTQLRGMFEGIFHEDPREPTLEQLAELLVRLCGGEQQACRRKKVNQASSCHTRLQSDHSVVRPMGCECE